MRLSIVSVSASSTTRNTNIPLGASFPIQTPMMNAAEGRRITEVCGVKETHCNHLQVCFLKAQFLAAQKAVDEVTVSTGDRSFISLRDISWIRPVSLECSYFSGKMPVMRDVAQSATLAAERASALRFMEDPT